MQLHKKPLVVAIAATSLASTQIAAAGTDESWFSYTEWDEGGNELYIGHGTGGYSIETDVPLFLVVGSGASEPYVSQNPGSIHADDNDAVTIDGNWESAILANSSTVSAQGITTPDFFPLGLSRDELNALLAEEGGARTELLFVERDEKIVGWRSNAIYVKGGELVGLSAHGDEAERLGTLAPFEADERVLIFNTGEIKADGHGIAVLGDMPDIDDDWRPVLRGNISNRGGLIHADNGYAVVMTDADLHGDIVNTGELRGRSGAIALLNGSRMTGNIHNHGVLTGVVSSAVVLDGAEFNGHITNYEDGEIHGFNQPAIAVRNSTGNIGIDQRGTLHAYRYLDALGSETELGQAMYLQGQNIHARLSDGSVIGDIDLDGATMTLAGGEYRGTITNRGGIFVVDGIHAIDGNYEQDGDATLRFSSQQLSSLSAERITLADGSTLVFGNGEAYRDGKQLVALMANELDFDLTALNLQTASGLYRVSKVEFNDDGSQLLVTYAGRDGEEIARRAIEASNATAVGARQLLGLGNALNRVLANSTNEAAVLALIDAVGESEQLEQLLPDSSGAVAGGTASASQTSSSAVSVRARGVAAGDAVASHGIWIQGLYGEIDQRARDGVEGFDSDTRGFVLGGDIETHNGSVLGFAWSRTSTDVDGKNGLVRSEIDFDQLTAYSGRAYGNWLFDAQLAYGWGDNETSRRVLGNTARANFDSKQFSAVAAAAYEHRLDSTTRLTPRISATYANLELDAHEEKGAGALNLRQDKQRIERLELGLETELAHTMPLGALMAEPRLTLGAYHDFQDKARSTTTAFTFAPEETFIVEGPKPDKTRYSAGLGIDLFSEGGFTTSADYAYGWSSSMSSHAGSLRIRYDF